MTFKLKPRGKGDYKKRYRPRKLHELAATAPMTRLLEITKKPKSQVYLFVGPSGVGKTTAARICARAINCRTKADSEKTKPCLRCPNCKGMEKSTDYVEVNVANFRKIDDVREMVSGLRYHPMHLKKIVYVLDEVHQLTSDAQQVLLKVLEDPPPSVMFFLCTTETKKLKKTFLDRCTRINFKSVDWALARDVIEQVCTQEKLDHTEDDGRRLYEASGGSIRKLLNNIEAFSEEGFDPDDGTGAEENPDAKKIFDALYDGSWGAASTLLRAPSVRERPETIRIGVECIARGYCLNAKKGVNKRAAVVLECMLGTLAEQPPISQYNMLVFRCMNACNSNRR